MADDRDSEDVTECQSLRKVQHARERGHLPISRELVTSCVLLAFVLVLQFVGPSVGAGLGDHLVAPLRQLRAWESPESLVRNTRSELLVGLAIAAVLLSIPLAVGIAASLMQTGFHFDPTALLPDFSRMDPIGRLGLIFTNATRARTYVAVAKCVILLIVAGIWMFTEFVSDGALKAEAPDDLKMAASGMAIRVVTKVSLLIVLFGLADYAATCVAWHRQLLLTRSEQKAEQRDMEGNPRLRQTRRRRHASLMSASSALILQPADLVVASRNRVAVALRGQGSSRSILGRVRGNGVERLLQQARRSGARVLLDSSLATELYESNAKQTTSLSDATIDAQIGDH